MSKTVKIIIVCTFSLFIICASAVFSFLVVQKLAKQDNQRVVIAGHQKFSFIQEEQDNNKVLIPYNTPFIIDDKDETTTYYKLVYKIFLPNNDKRSDLLVSLKIDTKENPILKESIFFSKRKLSMLESTTSSSVIKKGEDLIPAKKLYETKPNKEQFSYQYILYIQLKDKPNTDKVIEYSNFDVIINFKLVNTK